MENLRKNEYKRALELGFKPKYKVRRSNKGRTYYLIDYDYERYLKFLKTKIVGK